MARHYLSTFILWGILTGVGEFLVLRSSIFPTAAAEEARIVDTSFTLLMLLGIPVFTFVLAVLIYTLSSFRSQAEAPEDGPPAHGRPAVALLWIAITAGLAVYVIFNPGLKGLAELRANQSADLVVRVEGSRWFWKISYPDYGITAREILLPVNRRVRFDVTAVDVVHSFWIPAFRMKIDAVPGMVTRVYVTPTQTGTFQENYHFRLQCAELCGLGHSLMAAPLAVLPQEEFDAWVGRTRQ